MGFLNEFQGRMMGMIMALATIIFFGIGGAAIIVWWQGRSLSAVFTAHPSVGWQLITGTIAGTLIGILARFIVSRRSMEDMSMRYGMLIQRLQTTRADRIMISLCAGVGEELFFRGALQYWLGIPITAIVFVAIHGYLNFRDQKLFLYGLFMTTIMLGFGYVASQYGLWAPMVAHMMIDIVLLEYLNAIKQPALHLADANTEPYPDEEE